MNSISAQTYIEHVKRLALGIELIDSVRQRQPVSPVRVDVEYGLPHEPKLPKDRFCFARSSRMRPEVLCRHFSGRYALLYHPSLRDHINLRIYSPWLNNLPIRRHYLPRRLRVPLLTLEDIITIEETEQPGYLEGRSRYPVLFPGVGYHLIGGATGLRGRVLRDGSPMRWACIEARLPANDRLVGRTRGNERGEFLLLLDSAAAPASDLDATIDVRVEIAGPSELPVPADEQLPKLDPLWDAPIETLPSADQTDDVATGERLPAGYAFSVSARRVIPFQVGRILSGAAVGDFVF